MSRLRRTLLERSEAPAVFAPQGDFPAATLHVGEERPLVVPSSSGLVARGEDRFVVVSDDDGVYEVTGGEARLVLRTRDDDALEDLEGICRAPGGGLLVLSEARGQVSRIQLDPPDVIEHLGRLSEIGRSRNKGWEGLDLVPGTCSPDRRARLLAVHEGRPRRVGLFDLPDLGEVALLKLPRSIKDHASDLSDVSFETATGRFFLLSDESATIIETRLIQLAPPTVAAPLGELGVEGLAVHHLEVARKQKPEGLDFAADGSLWLVTDGSARLYRLELARE